MGQAGLLGPDGSHLAMAEGVGLPGAERAFLPDLPQGSASQRVFLSTPAPRDVGGWGERTFCITLVWKMLD